MTKISALECTMCNDIIFSRARHDFNTCSCGNIHIDGGFDYVKWGVKDKYPKHLHLEIEQTKKELFDDWNKYSNKFGKIKKDDLKNFKYEYIETKNVFEEESNLIEK